MQLIFCLVAAIALLGLWFWRKRATGDGSPPAGIVLFLTKPKPLNVQLLSTLLSEEAGVAVKPLEVESESVATGGNEPAGNFVAGRPPRFLAFINGKFFLILNPAEPYVNDPLKESEHIPESRRRKAMQDHKAWLSMDLLHPHDATPENYRLVGRVLARLMGPECVALFHPPTNQFAPYTDETAERLQSEDPIQTVFGEAYQPQVIPMEAGDPRIRAAQSEAQRRFPEFEQAFQRNDGTAFSVKAPISSRDVTEHIWIQVDDIRPDSVRGRLGNDPVDLEDFRLGSRVEVKRNQIEDWIYMRDGSPVGWFTEKMIRHAASEHQAGKP